MESKSLESLTLKRSYDPSVDGSDVINEFYIPCLANSIIYDRCSAYFSSAILKKFAMGLLEFYKNGGHGRFIFSCQIDPNEMNTIVEAYKEKMDSLADSLDSSLDNDYEIANLAYLIKHNVIEVKIAFMLTNRAALMHIKSGKFEDEHKNKVYFDGSGNETESGVLYNAEVFHVFRSSNEAQKEYLIDGEKRFEGLWNNTYSQYIITEYPTGKLFKKLLSYNKGKLFVSREDFFSNENAVFIDIDKDKNEIILSDFTKESIISHPSVLKTYYNQKFILRSERVAIIKELTLHNIRDLIPNRIKKYGVKTIYSDEALKYIAEYDLKLNMRIKLAESIKTNQNKELWEDAYLKFRSTIKKEMTATLKEEQFINAFHHYSMKSSMDFSVPGTGKTYISYGLFAYLYSKIDKQRDVDHLVVFGPLNCFKAWIEEEKAIFEGKHNFTIFDISKHRNDYQEVLENNKYDIYLFNYEFITKNRVEFLNKTVINKSTLIVFDEIHKLKATNGMRANAMISLIKMATSKPIYKLALTGTPLPNSYIDLSNYIDILYHDDLDGFLNTLSISKLKEADENIVTSKNISKSLHPLFTRTTKAELEIPPAEEDDLKTLSVEANEYEKELFELIYKSYRNPLLKFIRLIQASSNPQLILKKINDSEMRFIYKYYDAYCDEGMDDDVLFLEEKKELVNKIGISSKTLTTLNFISTLVTEKKKVLVWCLFVDTIDLIKKELTKRGIKCLSISGRDAPSTRSDKLDEFKFSDVDVLITNPNTLAESISLHMCCHDAIYLEFGFNLTYLLQSKDRIHRVGLENGTETNYYFAICTTNSNSMFRSVDTKIYERLQFKAEKMFKTIESKELIRLDDSRDIDDIKEILEIK